MALVLVLTGVAVVATVVMIVRDVSPPGDPYFLLLGALVLALLAQVVVGIMALVATDADVDAPTFVAYLFTALLVVPVGAALALVERSRWGSVVLLVALLTVAAMQLRLDSLWSVAGA